MYHTHQTQYIILCNNSTYLWIGPPHSQLPTIQLDPILLHHLKRILRILFDRKRDVSYTFRYTSSMFQNDKCWSDGCDIREKGLEVCGGRCVGEVGYEERWPWNSIRLNNWHDLLIQLPVCRVIMISFFSFTQSCHSLRLSSRSFQEIMLPRLLHLCAWVLSSSHQDSESFESRAR